VRGKTIISETGKSISTNGAIDAKHGGTPSHLHLTPVAHRLLATDIAKKIVGGAVTRKFTLQFYDVIRTAK